jgi:hypothetical protein
MDYLIQFLFLLWCWAFASVIVWAIRDMFD